MREDDLVIVRAGPMDNDSPILEEMQSALSVVEDADDWENEAGYPITLSRLHTGTRLSFKYRELIRLERRCE